MRDISDETGLHLLRQKRPLIRRAAIGLEREVLSDILMLTRIQGQIVGNEKAREVVERSLSGMARHFGAEPVTSGLSDVILLRSSALI